MILRSILSETPASKNSPPFRSSCSISEEKRMKVNIESVTQVAAEIFVSFSTELGFATAKWTEPLPKIGELYDVELEIYLGIIAKPASINICSIRLVDSFIRLSGSVISIDAEGVAGIEANGSIIPVEIIGFAGSLPVFVDLKVERVILFPTGI